MAAPPTSEYRYWAFISYSHKDEADARWLHRAIEAYGIPAKVVEHGLGTPTGEPPPKRFRPIFRDVDELAASADLGHAIEDALTASRYLIVICSPSAAQSQWVNREIEFFAQLGRSNRIFAYIVEGEPDSGGENECFPPALRQSLEPLAADSRPPKDGRSEAKLQSLTSTSGRAARRNDAKLRLLAGMLGIGFDALKQREAQQRIHRLQRVIAATLVLVAAFAGLAWYANVARGRAVVAEANAVSESHVRATAEANAVSEAHIRATAEAVAVSEAHARATAQAVAQDQRDRAQAGQLATFGLVRQDDRFDLALLLVNEAYRKYDTFDTRAGLLGSLEVYPNLRSFLHGRRDRIWTLAVSPDGRLAAAGSDSGEILLWSLEQPSAAEKILTAGPGAILSLAFSANGAILAAGRCTLVSDNGSCAQSEVRLWRPADGQDLGALTEEAPSAVLSLAFRHDDRMLAAGGLGVMLWDVGSHKAVTGTIHTAQGQMLDLAFSPDGRSLLTANKQQHFNSQAQYNRITYTGLVQMWNIPDGSFAGKFQQCPSAWEMSVAFRSDGTPLAACDSGGLIYVWDMNTHDFTIPLAGQSGIVTALAFSSDGRRLASGGCGRFKNNGISCIEGEVRLWDLEQWSQLGQPLRGTANYVTSLALSRDGNTLIFNSASESAQSAVLAWNFANPRTLGQPIVGLTGDARSLAVSPDGRILAVGGGDGAIALATLNDGETATRTLKNHAGSVGALAFNPDGNLLASGDSDGMTRLWDVVTGEPRLGPLQSAEERVWDLAFTPDGTLVVANAGPSVRWWDLTDGIMIGQPFTATIGQVTALTLSPAGDRLAAAACQGPGTGLFDCADARISLWDLEKRSLIASPLTGHPYKINHLGFNPAGTQLASAGCARMEGGDCLQGDVRIWDAETGQLIGEPLTDHTENVIGVAFSPDGAILASFSEEQQIILWDTAILHPIGQINARGGSMPMIFSADGKRLITSGAQVMQWDVDPAGWQAQACRIANRNLTQGEWKTYIGDAAFQKTCPELP